MAFLFFSLSFLLCSIPWNHPYFFIFSFICTKFIFSLYFLFYSFSPHQFLILYFCNFVHFSPSYAFVLFLLCCFLYFTFVIMLFFLSLLSPLFPSRVVHFSSYFLIPVYFYWFPKIIILYNFFLPLSLSCVFIIILV